MIPVRFWLAGWWFLVPVADAATPPTPPPPILDPSPPGPAEVVDLPNFRTPANDGELRAWLENMRVYHRFTDAEMAAATGLAPDLIQTSLQRWNLDQAVPPPQRPGDPLRILPYPGGRHPRIGFLDGAIRPQRETKVSLFTPWDPYSYVVVDVPEALWSHLGLTYLAHTHIPTLWDQRGHTLPPLEWTRHPDGSLSLERTLPNGIVLGSRVTSTPGDVRFDLWIRNGTSEPLRDLRAQVCAMLKGAPGFTHLTSQGKVLRPPYAAARAPDTDRWIITAWQPLNRAWENPPVPCLHADPAFPDCPPGDTVRAHGRLWFHEGPDLDAALARLEASGWR